MTYQTEVVLDGINISELIAVFKSLIEDDTVIVGHKEYSLRIMGTGVDE
jgi:hypothetical protein